MSQDSLPRPITEESDFTTVDIDVMDETSVNMDETDIRPFIPPSHDTIPSNLFYEAYKNDSLWSPRGLETDGRVLGFALNEDFFLNVLKRHLSYTPMLATPWFFSPFISTYAIPLTANRPVSAYKPEKILKIRVERLFNHRGISSSDDQPYIYSLRKLVTELEIPAMEYKNRPSWEHEYLIFKRVPVEAIVNTDREQYIDVC